MLNKTLFTLLLLLSSLSFAQRNAVFSQNSVLGDSITTETYTLNEVVSDSVLLYLLTGYMPIKVDTISATSNITLQTNQELIPDSNKWYGTTSGDWVLVGSGDTTVNADSSLTLIDSSSAYIALPVTTDTDYLHTISFNAKTNDNEELNTNTSLDFSYTELNTDLAFDLGTGWGGSKYTISEGHANFDASTSGGGTITRQMGLTIDKAYFTSFNYNLSSGGFQLVIDGTDLTYNTIGEYLVSNRVWVADYSYVYFYLLGGTPPTGWLDNISVKELVAPTGWTSATMTATDYVIEDNGCKLVEVTGTTYIEYDSLSNGTYEVIANISAFTSGELNAYNGATEYPFNASTGLDTVYIDVVDSTLRLQVDNNTNLTVSSLSIKKYPRRKVYWSYGSIADSSEVLTATDTLLSINSYGQGADSLKIWTTENSEITISEPSILKYVNTSFIVTKGDTNKVYFTLKTDSVASYTDTITTYYAGRSLETIVSWAVVPDVDITFYQNLVQTDTLDFGTVSSYSTVELLLINEGLTDVYSNGFGGLTPFTFVSGVSPVPNSSSAIWTFAFNPVTDTTIIQTVNILFTDAVNGGWYKPLVFKVVVESISEPTLSAPNIIANSIDSTDGISFQCENSGDVLAYKLYGEYDGEGFSLLATQTSRTFTDNPITLTDRRYFIQAYNSADTLNGDTITVSAEPTGNKYFVSTSDGSDSDNGTTPATAWQTIAKVNGSAIVGYDVYFNSGDAFDDVTLEAKTGSMYTTYGGSTKAVIGDSLSSLTRSVYINSKTDVTLTQLKIFGSANTSANSANGIYINGTLTYSNKNTLDTSNIEINNCQIVGGSGSWQAQNHGIYVNNTKGVRIFDNEIKKFGRGITAQLPYYLHIDGNDIHDIHYLQSRTGVTQLGSDGGGGTGIELQGTYDYDGNGIANVWDANYTVKISHNDIYNHERWCMGSTTISKIIVEYNEMHDNLDERTYQGGIDHGGGAMKIDDLDHGFGVDFPGAIGSIVRYNKFYNFNRHQTSRQYTVNDNTFESDGTVYLYKDYTAIIGTTYQQFTVGSVIDGSGIGLEYYGNVMYDCGLTAFNRAGKLGVSHNYSGYKNEVYNNVFWNVSTDLLLENGSYEYSGACVVKNGDNMPPLYVKNNIMYVNNATGANIYSNSGVIYQGNNIFVNTVGDKTYLSGGLNHSNLTSIFAVNGFVTEGSAKVELTTSQATALFVDASSKDFRTNSNAYLVDKGAAIGNDANGELIAELGYTSGTHDIGAYEYGYTESTDPEPSAPTPVIVTQPTTVYCAVGDTVQFTVEAVLDGTLAYQWWDDGLGIKLVDGSKYSGVTTKTLTVKNVQFTDSLTNMVCEVYNANRPDEFAPDYWVNTNEVRAIADSDYVEPSAECDPPVGDLFTSGDGCFETSIGSWVTLGTNTVAVSTDWSGLGNQSLKISYVDHGSGAYLFLSTVGDLITNLVVGNSYTVTLTAKMASGGAATVRVLGGNYQTLLDSDSVTDSESTITLTITAESTHYDYILFSGLTAGEIVYIDDISIVAN